MYKQSLFYCLHHTVGWCFIPLSSQFVIDFWPDYFQRPPSWKINHSRVKFQPVNNHLEMSYYNRTQRFAGPFPHRGQRKNYGFINTLVNSLVFWELLRARDCKTCMWYNFSNFSIYVETQKGIFFLKDCSDWYWSSCTCGNCRKTVCWIAGCLHCVIL